VLSVDPVATRLPSGDQATLMTQPRCPSSVRISLPVVVSQICAQECQHVLVEQSPREGAMKVSDRAVGVGASLVLLPAAPLALPPRLPPFASVGFLSSLS